MIPGQTPSKKKIEFLFLSSFVSSSSRNGIFIPGYNPFESDKKFSKAKLQMDFWYEHNIPKTNFIFAFFQYVTLLNWVLSCFSTTDRQQILVS